MTTRGGRATDDYAFEPRHFAFLRDLAQDKAGIALAESKQDLVYGRIVRRIRALGLPDFDAYCALLGKSPGAELANFINAITTNLTSFFREAHHFEFLQSVLVPHWVKTRGASPALRIWSAGCSTGEEPYSIAIALLEALPGNRARHCQVIATDIDTQVLAEAGTASYDLDRLTPAVRARLEPWCQRGAEANGGRAHFLPQVRQMVSFQPLNLVGPWPLRGPFDLVFCRNVVIYFDKPTQRRLFERFADVLAPDGHLIIGHAETLYGMTDRFELVGRTVYRRAGAAGGVAR